MEPNKILTRILGSHASLAYYFPNELDPPFEAEDLFPRNRRNKRRRRLHALLDIDDKPTEKTIERDPQIMTAFKDIEFPLDPFYRRVLKKHQIEGLKFMWDRVCKDKKGCLLSHSMGLGKSLQTIALLITIYQQLRKYPSLQFPAGNRVLILGPLVTLSNWAEEFRKWSAGDIEDTIGEVFMFSTIRGGNKIREKRIKFLHYWYTHGGVMLMSYEQFRALLTEKKPSIGENSFGHYILNPGPDIVVLDEGHRIKNSTTALALLVTQFKTPSRICLTGYPLQNHLLEYYYMISFVSPGLLGTPEHFKAHFVNTKKKTAAIKLYTLQLMTNKVTHRRDESILRQELPPKHEYLVKFKLSQVQLEGYTHLLNGIVENGGPLIALLVLRSMCNHPKIFQNLLQKRIERKRNAQLDKEMKQHQQNIEEEVAVQDIEEDIAAQENEEDELVQWLSLETNQPMIEYFEQLNAESWTCSGKMTFVANLAIECSLIQEKIVVVSHSLACLDYIQHILPVFGMKALRVDGHTVGNERQHIINKFSTDQDVSIMLLSAKAAAIGINLTAANRIVLVDQDWNPLYDEQSIGRIYRYNQTKPVYVYRLVTASTIEERILNQSIHKNSIFRRVIDNQRFTANISKDELRQYYMPPDPTIATIEVVSAKIKQDNIACLVYAKNKEMIVQAEPYIPASLEDKIGNTSWYELTSQDRDEAISEVRRYKKDAIRYTKELETI
ncbi:P-loop containing nucleoside triphosphate hydrolase protein [Gilbertella persicaria]|uniref:P-loop containing nucleoside triphosphate hydrolase protein n=1 Tax=Gilbertella persicaria TaxID=101096 RepID=UPI002220E722|nr:P-loop containing nucleoside triphosphate hydrolase protein [Gilbertella persicaria]KAI8060388.1 P-loop containing nucleoside triphosphate hydrolase protein [Gilbertella persicaria]